MKRVIMCDLVITFINLLLNIDQDLVKKIVEINKNFSNWLC